jgi:hypothetical protein
MKSNRNTSNPVSMMIMFLRINRNFL